MRTRKEIVQAAINEGIDRKNDLLQELGSARSGSRASRASMSSSTLRAHARGEAAAALKKAEMQKRINEHQCKSAMALEIEERKRQEDELAFARRKREEEARLECLRVEQEAAAAVARAKAIDEELRLPDVDKLPDLPLEEPSKRVQNFINSQLNGPNPRGQEPDASRFTASDFPARSFKEETPQVDPPRFTAPGFPPKKEKPDPRAPPFTPSRTAQSSDPADRMDCFIQFMARRELIANKIEKFDNRPENFNTWKAAFKNMTSDVNITASEELALMLEYTTGESKRLVQRLRNAYIENPSAGVRESWKKLGERFGSTAVITNVHLNKLTMFPALASKDNKGLQELGDLLLELQCAKEDGGLAGLKILDEPAFLKPVLVKLPQDLQGRWQRHAYRYKTQHRVDYPPFREFASFIQEIAREQNDPYLSMESQESKSQWKPFVKQPVKPPIKPPVKPPIRPTDMPPFGQGLTAFRTDITDPALSPPTRDPTKWCIVHKLSHPLSKCRAFRTMPLTERRNLLSQHRICFHCLATTSHLAKDCTVQVKCSECHSDKHVSALHAGPPSQPTAAEDAHQHGGEPTVTSSCTEVCGDTIEARSCAKICLANIYAISQPENKIKAYVVIDDQSNCSLAKPKLFDILNLDGEATPYVLKTCAGTSQVQGRRARNLVIESLDGTHIHMLPILTECSAIPDSREEIPTPAVARAHPHLKDIAEKIPELDPEVEILLLVGRDAPPLHKIHESRNGPRNAPWAQRLDLGWVVLGNVCLDGAHKPAEVSSYRTQVLDNGRPSFLLPCSNRIYVKHGSHADSTSYLESKKKKGTFLKGSFEDGLGDNVFASTKDDNRPGMSVEDRQFIQIMNSSLARNEAGSWEAPLPVRDEFSRLPNNREDAVKRFKSTTRALEKKPLMKQHYFDFMQKLFEKRHAEPAPELSPSAPRWYLPHFGVYHPQKPDKIRVVFDSAAETKGTSLNKILLSGPDLTNNLLGVLLRFRQDTVAFMADIEQMFHSFLVQEQHRDLLRFFWYKDNDPNGEPIEYRMKVHVFGNTSSPAVATYCLRKTAEVGEQEFGSDAKDFVHDNFYVDDGLKSVAKPAEAIDLLVRTRAMLAKANLRLHKIASSHPEVTRAFPKGDQASDLRDLDFSLDTVPVQRALGVLWDISADALTFKVCLGEKPFTRRGVLSVLNSLYDPLGLTAPVIVRGKLLLRSMMANLSNFQPESWDEPLPEEQRPPWETWCKALQALTLLRVPRCYTIASSSAVRRRELHTFCDASNDAIGAVSYLRTIQHDGIIQVSFVLGKAKLAPSNATTIPRLELCAAILGIEMTELINQELDVKPDTVVYYSDSRVVLGYITNETRRFYVYVSNRVERIRKSSSPEQWYYVPSQQNLADLATRSVDAQNLSSSIWLRGPNSLHQQDTSFNTTASQASETAEDDPEVRPVVQALATQILPKKPLGTSRFSRFSQWETLVRAIARILLAMRTYHQRTQGKPSTTESTKLSVSLLDRAKFMIIKNVQREAYEEELSRLNNSDVLPKTSPLLKICPVIDNDGLLRVGGRLERASLSYEESHPLILPSSHHITSLLIKHYHERVQHQGRHFTLGLIRSSGIWIVGGKRAVNSAINNCIKCKKLRGRQQIQKMGDLPIDRLTPAPPFSYVGLDVFGPWLVSARRTRGGVANSKRWAVLFTCLTTRAIHIEVIESMDTSCFINALRRFLALRGPAIQLRSDCGTNFVGARNELQSCLNEMDDSAIQSYLANEGCEWIFNPPHASHVGGVWERMIGVTRRILDSILADLWARTSHS